MGSEALLSGLRSVSVPSGRQVKSDGHQVDRHQVNRNLTFKTPSLCPVVMCSSSAAIPTQERETGGRYTKNNPDDRYDGFCRQ